MENDFDVSKLKLAVEAGRVEWKRHALERMTERGIGREDIFYAIMGGKVIESYPKDRPFPSFLYLGWKDRGGLKKPLHVVVAFDVDGHQVYIITAYEPTEEYWKADFEKRKT